MCEICLKYRCPDRCPNSYIPKGRGNRKSVRLGFVTLFEIDGRGTALIKEETQSNK